MRSTNDVTKLVLLLTLHASLTLSSASNLFPYGTNNGDSSMSNVGYTEFDLSAPLPIGNGQTLDNLVVRDIYISINFFNNYFVIGLSKNVLTYF